MEIEKKCDNSVTKMKTVGAFVYVRVNAEGLGGKRVVETVAFVSLETDALLRFELVGALMAPQQKAE